MKRFNSISDLIQYKVAEYESNGISQEYSSWKEPEPEYQAYEAPAQHNIQPEPVYIQIEKPQYVSPRLISNMGQRKVVVKDAPKAQIQESPAQTGSFGMTPRFSKLINR